VHTVGQFIDHATKLAEQWCKEQQFAPWFRGQPSASFQLLPSKYREPNQNLIEIDCRFDFRTLGYPFLEGVAREPKSEWEWYFLMQHFGLPTRLLDWSESALVALYFALIDPPGKRPKDNPVVWMLDPWAVNDLIAKKGARIFSAEDDEMKRYLPLNDRAPRIPLRPVSIQAPYASRRITAQKGRFTLHGRAKQGLESYPQLKGYLHKIEVSRRSREEIIRQLATAGVTITAVFPDITNLATELREYWS